MALRDPPRRVSRRSSTASRAARASCCSRARWGPARPRSCARPSTRSRPTPRSRWCLNTSDLRPLDLLKLIAAEFRLGERLESKVDYVIALNAYLLDRLRTGRQHGSHHRRGPEPRRGALEEVRLLSNLETDTEKLLQIVLTGQPELKQKLAAREPPPAAPADRHRAPRAARSRRARSGPSSRHRIQVAGGRYEEVFAPGVERDLLLRSPAASRACSACSPTGRCSPPSRSRSGRCPPPLVEAEGEGDGGGARGQELGEQRWVRSPTRCAAPASEQRPSRRRAPAAPGSDSLARGRAAGGAPRETSSSRSTRR